MRRLLIFGALLFAFTLASGATAGAQTDPGVPPYGGNPPVDVGGEVIDDDGEVLGDVATRRPAAAAGVRSRLPITGGDLLGLAAIGLGAVGLGAGMVAYRRRVA